MHIAFLSHGMRVGLALAIITPCVAAGPTIPEKVKETIREHVAKGVTPSVSVGLIDKTGTTYFSHGQHAVDNATPVNEDSIYEIGSISKVFTAILLADLAKQGKVALTDPVEKYLPEEVKVPQRNGKITLELLSTHRSGLPRMPDNFAPADRSNPYVDYDAAKLYEFLSNHELTRDVNESQEYSNIGVGLLGHALSRASGQSYESMVRERICKPLGMASTVVTFTPELKSRVANGHNGGEVVPNWDLTTLAGAGAIRSSARDMIAFLSANLGLADASIYPVLQRTHQRGKGSMGRPLNTGLGWFYRETPNLTIVWHNGGTAGFRAFCGFSPEKKAGVVVLSNSGNQGMDELGIEILELHEGFSQGRKVVEVSDAILDKYAGRYFVRPGFVIRVKAKVGMLDVTVPGSGNSDMHAESQNSFFSKSKDAQVSFVMDGSKVTELVYVHKGKEQRARRLQ